MEFNNIDFTEYFNILEINRPLLPKVRTYETEVPSKDGYYTLNKSTLDANIIGVKIELKADNRQEKRDYFRRIAGLLFTREEKKLRFHDEPDKYYMAKLSEDTNLNEFYLYGVTTLQFKANDPIAYGKTIKHNISGTTQINLTCTEKTKPKFAFNITSSVSKIEIKNNLGEYVLINHNFVNGDKVVVDFNDKWKARKNGNVIAKDITILSDFFNLEVGMNTIIVNIPCELEYKERWL